MDLGESASIRRRRRANLSASAGTRRIGFTGPPRRGLPGETILEARDLVLSHAGRAEPVLRGASLSISAGDRILLEGPSGSGKSTLAALLSGLRAPDSGLLLFEGLDPRTLGGDGWRRRIVVAPQFHENHVLAATFAFDLQLGVDGPLSPQALASAWESMHDPAAHPPRVGCAAEGDGGMREDVAG